MLVKLYYLKLWLLGFSNLKNVATGCSLNILIMRLALQLCAYSTRKERFVMCKEEEVCTVRVCGVTWN